MMLHTKYKGFKPCGVRQEEFLMFFPIKAYLKHVTPRAKLLSQGYNLNKLGTGSLGNASYQTSRLYALRFQTRRFFLFLPI